MLFKDYEETGRIYHIAPITDLEKILREGIQYDDKSTYYNKYYDFHVFIDDLRPSQLPPWVERKKAIFGTMNYRRDQQFHSHTIVMALRVEMSRCWIANENKVNQLYEPFILQEIEDFYKAKHYMKTEGIEMVKEYWETSLSFEDNRRKRRDKQEGYDGEVLIFHPISPDDIEVLYIVSDHRILTLQEWKEIFCSSW